jgi:hypothetical protein
MVEKRQILNFMCSNVVWKDGRLHPNYRQSFGLLAVTNHEYQKKAAFTSESDLRSVWLPLVDEVQTFFASLSEEIVDIIVAAQGVIAA